MKHISNFLGVKSNLHLVLTLETNSNLNELFNQYPSMYLNTEMLFVQDFRTETSQQLPSKIIQQLNAHTKLSKMPSTNLFAHSLVGDWKRSPLRYQQLIKTYFFVYVRYLEKMENRREKLQVSFYRKIG